VYVLYLHKICKKKLGEGARLPSLTPYSSASLLKNSGFATAIQNLQVICCVEYYDYHFVIKIARG